MITNIQSKRVSEPNKFGYIVSYDLFPNGDVEGDPLTMESGVVGSARADLLVRRLKNQSRSRRYLDQIKSTHS